MHITQPVAYRYTKFDTTKTEHRITNDITYVRTYALLANVQIRPVLLSETWSQLMYLHNTYVRM